MEKRTVPVYKPRDQKFSVEEAKKENLVGRRISGARKALGMNQGDLASALASYDVHIKITGISRWESGWSLPNTLQMIAVCKILHIDDGFARLADDFASPSLSLNEKGLRKLEEYRYLLLQSGEYIDKVDDSFSTESVKFSPSGASAGPGTMLDDEYFEERDFPAALVPDGTDFATRVTGTSMEPYLHDGDTLFVKRQDHLRPGDLGLFLWRGESYVKEYQEQTPSDQDREAFTGTDGSLYMQPVLLSYNTAGGANPPKVIRPGDTFMIIGKILR